MALLATHRVAVTGSGALARRHAPCVAARPASRRSLVWLRAAGDKGGSPPLADDFMKTGEPPRNFWDVMTFDGPAPEAINGRLAMLGFTAAMAAELATGRGVLQQFWQAPLPIIGVAALLVLASLIPILRGADLHKQNNIWRLNAEIINGRAAMVGLVALLITEAIRGKALWGV